jgi:hypothetical protein
LRGSPTVECPAFGFCLLEEREDAEETKDVTDLFSYSESLLWWKCFVSHFTNLQLEEDETYRGRGCSFSLRLRSPISVLASIARTDIVNRRCTWIWY